jgi:hypothetical protein
MLYQTVTATDVANISHYLYFIYIACFGDKDHQVLKVVSLHMYVC